MSRKINVIVDNDSWVIPYAKNLVKKINAGVDRAVFVSSYDKVKAADVSFYIGCMKITPPSVMAKSKANLVIHASHLPKGRGFSPITWQLLEGKKKIPICLIEMAEQVDSGDILKKDYISFAGHELVDEIRQKQGEATIKLCLDYLKAKTFHKGKKQVGKPSWYARRRPEDSRLDLKKTLGSQFNQLRVADNEKYPAYFEKDGYIYTLKIEKKKK